jgi:hypothetical protein
MDEPEVGIYDNGTGKWWYEYEFPLKRTQWTKFYLYERITEEEVCGNISRAEPGQEEPDSYNNINLNTALTA